MGRYNDGSGLFTASEFKNRGIIKLAPDVLVYINGSFGTTVIAPVAGSNQNVDFKDGISSLSIQNNIEPPGSSTASVEIVTPRYNERSNYWVDFTDKSSKNTYKIPILVPMMEIQIYLKGRFLVGNQPQYYPAFWGLILSVEESFSGGLWKFNLQCVDMLHWWEWMEVAIRPGVKDNFFLNNKMGLTAYGTRYEEANPFEIIYTLCQSAGMDAFIPPGYVDKAKSSIVERKGDWNSFFSNALAYWNGRFQTQASLLKMYGATGTLIQKTRTIVPNKIIQTPDIGSADKSKQSTKNSVQYKWNLDETEDKFLGGSKVFFIWEEMKKSLDESEFWTRLQVATELKNRVDYEFFQDVNGNLIFKPAFYNMNVKNSIVYNINPTDIINYSSMLLTDQLVTVVDAQGGFSQQLADASKPNYMGYHADLELMKKFGFRKKSVTPWYLGGKGADILQSYCVSHMSICNAKAHTASITMSGRPEMRLGYPIYMTHNDAFYYVKSINHTFDYGGSFITSLSLEGERHKVYNKDNEALTSCVYKRSSKKISPDDLLMKAASKTMAESKETAQDDVNKLAEIYRNVGITKSMEPGFYDIVKDEGIVTFTNNAVPYTDSEGYKVIGGFRYGRDLNINTKTGNGLEDSLKKSATETPEQIANNRAAQTVLNIRPISDAEGASMEEYFKQTDRKDVESFIPDYLKFPGSGGPNPDPNTAAFNIATMT